MITAFGLLLLKYDQSLKSSTPTDVSPVLLIFNVKFGACKIVAETAMIPVTADDATNYILDLYVE